MSLSSNEKPRFVYFLDGRSGGYKPPSGEPVGHEPHPTSDMVGATTSAEDRVLVLEARWELGERLTPEQIGFLVLHEEVLDLGLYEHGGH